MPKLRDASVGHLDGFRKGPHFAGFLAEVKPFIEYIEEMQHYESTGIASRPSIYEAVGGAGTFFRLARDMHAAMQKDDLLGPMFANSPAAHVPHLAMWLCEVFGGPLLWTDTLGDVGRMLAKHANLNLSEAQRARFRELAVGAARQHIEDDAAVAAVGRYFDWGTAVAVENSKPGHVPDAAAGIPRWDLGVSDDCRRLEESARRSLAELAGPCEVDADCVLYDGTCPLGCTIIASKWADFGTAEAEVKRYFDACASCKYDCAPGPAALSCVEERCVAP